MLAQGAPIPRWTFDSGKIRCVISWDALGQSQFHTQRNSVDCFWHGRFLSDCASWPLGKVTPWILLFAELHVVDVGDIAFALIIRLDIQNQTVRFAQESCREVARNCDCTNWQATMSNIAGNYAQFVVIPISRWILLVIGYHTSADERFDFVIHGRLLESRVWPLEAHTPWTSMLVGNDHAHIRLWPTHNALSTPIRRDINIGTVLALTSHHDTSFASAHIQYALAVDRHGTILSVVQGVWRLERGRAFCISCSGRQRR